MALEDDSIEAYSVVAWSPTRELVEGAVLENASEGALLLLPDKFSGAGKAQYRDFNAGLVKTVRANGASLEYAYSRDEREFLSEYSAGEVIDSIVLGVIGNYTADVIKMMATVVWQRVRAASHKEGKELEQAKVCLKIAEYSIEPGRKVLRGLKYTGPVGGVERALLAALENPNSTGEASNPLEPGAASTEE